MDLFEFGVAIRGEADARFAERQLAWSIIAVLLIVSHKYRANKLPLPFSVRSFNIIGQRANLFYLPQHTVHTNWG